MDEKNWKKRSEIITEIAIAMAAAKYPYSGGAMVCLPDNKQLTRKEHWDSLTEEEQHSFLDYAYAAYNVMGGYGFREVMALAFEEYLDEK